MRIALANVILCGRTGTEVVTMDLARGLSQRGHQLFIFAPEVGKSGQEFIAEGYQVIDDLVQAPFEPDIVHGNHNVALVQTLIRFPGSQGVFVSHDATLWQNSAPAMTRIREFVAVDRLNRERIERELVRVAGSVHVIHNAVDLQRFNARGPLPDHPRKALILAKNWPHIKAIQAACARFGLDCELLGKAVGQEVSDLPQRLHHYDVVFATARMAIEAMAVGCAVVVCDARGLAGMVTSKNVVQWREDNFGLRILTKVVEQDSVFDELKLYDATDATKVSAFIRQHNDLQGALDRYENVYRLALAHDHSVARDLEAAEISAVLRGWLPNLQGQARARADFVRAEKENHHVIVQAHAKLLQAYDELSRRRLGPANGQAGFFRTETENYQTIVQAHAKLLQAYHELTQQRFGSRHAMQATYPLGHVIDFGLLGDATRYCEVGWSQSELWGTWTDGNVARLRIAPVANEGIQLIFVARLLTFVNPLHVRQHVDVLINGRLVNQWIFDSPEETERTVRMPPDLLYYPETIEITFVIPTARSPAELGLSDDSRRLGIGLVHARIDAAAGPGESQTVSVSPGGALATAVCA